MSRTSVALALVLAVCGWCTGCATLKHGGRQSIQFISAPESASVFIDGVEVGQTPLSYGVERRANHEVRIELIGFKPFETRLERRFSGWAWGNLVFIGLSPVAAVVDVATGAIYRLTPEQLVASLERSGVSLDPGWGPGLQPDDGRLYIMAVLEADPAWERIDRLEPLH